MRRSSEKRARRKRATICIVLEVHSFRMFCSLLLLLLFWSEHRFLAHPFIFDDSTLQIVSFGSFMYIWYLAWPLFKGDGVILCAVCVFHSLLLLHFIFVTNCFFFNVGEMTQFSAHKKLSHRF